MNHFKELLTIFGRIGCTAYGGPAAHIAILEDELVTKRKWVSSQHFLDLIGATSLIPGPNSTEMVMHLGYERAGWKGLFLAGAAFIIPAALTTLLLAWIYAEYGTTPALEPLLAGIKPAVLVIIISATWKLAKKAVKSWELALTGVLAVVACVLFTGYTTSILLATSLFGVILLQAKKLTGVRAFALPYFLFPLATSSVEQVASLSKLALFFLKVGAVLYGSGYVLVSFLEMELVHELKWLTEAQLLDAIAIGQFTPGPVLSTATFVGYLVGGFPGAVVATVCIFLPSFFFVLLLNPIVPKLRKSKLASSFLDSVNVAALGLMFFVSCKLAYSSILTWQSLVIFICAALLHFRLKLNSAWVVGFGAVGGYLLSIVTVSAA